jgi:hypothetical protein
LTSSKIKALLFKLRVTYLASLRRFMGWGRLFISLVSFIPMSDNQLLDISNLCSRMAMISEPLTFLVRAHDWIILV